VFDRDLIFDKLNPLHHQARNLLFRFKARVVERGVGLPTSIISNQNAKITISVEINSAAIATTTPSMRSPLLGKALQSLAPIALGFPDRPDGDRDPLASEGER
jgi:hypothetical protein